MTVKSVILNSFKENKKNYAIQVLGYLGNY